MHEITHYGFQNDVRRTLRFQHGFEHHDLERVSGIFSDTLTKIKTPGSLKANHFDTAMKEMVDHPEWKRLSSRQQESVESALKQHLHIHDN